jgi:hypothetical protein
MVSAVKATISSDFKEVTVLATKKGVLSVVPLFETRVDFGVFYQKICVFWARVLVKSITMFTFKKSSTKVVGYCWVWNYVELYSLLSSIFIHRRCFQSYFSLGPMIHKH